MRSTTQPFFIFLTSYCFFHVFVRLFRGKTNVANGLRCGIMILRCVLSSSMGLSWGKVEALLYRKDLDLTQTCEDGGVTSMER